MRISFNWLKQYIELKNSPEEIAETLTRIGLEVESMEHLGEKFDGFVIGHVLDVQKHPNADRLSVCKVQLAQNEEPKQIVCGAPNVATGQKVIVGLPGATVPSNQHDPEGKPFVLSKAKIRGVESNGMICSETELGLGEDKSGIKVLDPSVPVGLPLAEYLGLNDTAMEIGITPNRPDCLCHMGIARDLAAVYGKKMQKPVSSTQPFAATSVEKNAVVEIQNPSACRRYTARVIRNVTVQDSPEWMKRLLTAAGLRPINNVVDVTNFVMLEYGQPLHAFDLNRLARQTIVVKSASPGETFQTLDGKVHHLSGNEVMICDGEKPVAIGGIMGGMNSEISQETSTVLLECAYFDPVSIRRAAKKLGMSTDASYRFERGTDPGILDEVSLRAASLIAEVAGGEVLNGVIDVYPAVIERKKITLRPSKVNGILGTDIPTEKIRSILISLGIEIVRDGDNSWECAVPTYRPDIEQEIDLVEEVARLYGYDNIPNQSSGEVVFSEPSAIERRLDEIRLWLQSNGFNEVVTNSLIDEPTARMFSEAIVKVKNPLSAELEVLRPRLLPSLLQSVMYNFNHGANAVRLFEVGTTFDATGKNIEGVYIDGIMERRNVGMIIAGFAGEMTWHQKQRYFDIYDAKGLVLSMLRAAGIDNPQLIYYDASTSLTEQTIGIEINGTYAGYIGRCSDQLLKKYKIEKDVYIVEMDLDLIVNVLRSRKFKEYSKFPTVVRDVAFIVNTDIPVGEIERTISEAGGSLITGVTLFDIFSGKNLGEGKKSVAFSVKVNAFDRTLKDSEIDEVVGKVIQVVSSTYGATLRSI